MTVMVTEGNNVHSPEYHAEVTAAKLVDIAASASAEKHAAGRELRKRIEAILIAHHTKVHHAEQQHLAAKGAARYDEPLDASEHVDADIVPAIVAAAQGTILAAHFARADVQAAILSELHHESRSQMHVHRLVHHHRTVAGQA